MLVVLHHLSRIPGATHLLAAIPDLLQPLLAAATTPELQQTHPCLSVVGLTLDDLDCEMKVVVWGILSAGAEATPTHPSVTRSGGSRVTPECPGTARSSSKQGRDGAAPATAGSGSRIGTSRSSRGCGVDPCLQEAVGAGLLQVLLLYGEGGAGLTGVVGPGERRYSGEQQQLLQRHAWARLLQVRGVGGRGAAGGAVCLKHRKKRKHQKHYDRRALPRPRPTHVCARHHSHAPCTASFAVSPHP